MQKHFYEKTVQICLSNCIEQLFLYNILFRLISHYTPDKHKDNIIKLFIWRLPF